MNNEEEYNYIATDVGFYNEIIGYTSVVNYEDEFNDLCEDIKIDLKNEVDFLFNYFTNPPVTNSSIFLENNKQICNLNFDIDMYIYEVSSSICRIGVQMFLHDNSTYQLQHFAYMAPINIKNVILYHQEEMLKEYFYNALTLTHIFCRKFQYHPMLTYMYHRDDIPAMGEIKLRRTRLFGDDEIVCSVCFEQTIVKTVCNHYLCHGCYSRLKIKSCPLCRASLENQILFYIE